MKLPRLILAVGGFLLSGMSALAQICPVQVARLDSGTAYGMYGASVSIGQGMVAVGAPEAIERGDGAVYLYARVNSTWQLQATLFPDEGFGGGFGSALSLHSPLLAVGADHDNTLAPLAGSSGAVYVFADEGAGIWTRLSKLLAPDGDDFDYLGHANAVATDGERILGGAYGSDINGFAMGAAYTFSIDSQTHWNFEQELLGTPGGSFGGAVALTNNRLFIGATGESASTGALYIFEQDEAGVWQQAAKLFASDGETGDYFGWSIGAEGDVIAVGTPFWSSSKGAVYLFEHQGDGSWAQTAELTASDSGSFHYFGTCVAMSGDLLLANSTATNGHGQVHVFQRDSGGVWSEQTKLSPSDSYNGDGFGVVALQGTTAVVGAPWNPTLGEDGGAVYIFELACGTPGCTGDLNADGQINLTDLAIQLAHYGEIGAPPEHGDLNGDGIIDLTDLAALLAVYGTTCP